MEGEGRGGTVWGGGGEAGGGVDVAGSEAGGVWMCGGSFSAVGGGV